MRTRIQKKKDYYQIKKVHLWIAAGIVLCLFLLVNFKQDIYNRWEHSQKRKITPFEQLDSKLQNKKKCYLCGKNKKSLMGYYRKFDTIGVICLCEWYVTDFGLHESIEQKIMPDDKPHVSFGITNAGALSVMKLSSPNRGMAEIDISLPQNYGPDIEMLQENLCQGCLDNVIDTLDVSKGEYETKQAYPLCLVDFQTLEVYPLQDWHTGCSIRDYWVEMEYAEDSVIVKAFYLPTKSEK